MKKEIKILDIFYGNKCNLACSQCDTHSDHVRGTQDDPELENIKQSITLAHKHFNVDLWGILGGEPLLYIDKCTAILDHLRSLDPESKACKELDVEYNYLSGQVTGMRYILSQVEKG